MAVLKWIRAVVGAGASGAGGTDGLMREAFGHHRSGEVARAEALYRRILEAEPGHADALYLLGEIERERGNLEAAIGLLEGAMRGDGSNARFYYGLGCALQAAGYHERARASYRRAVELDPADAEAWNNLGGVEQGLGRLAEAEGCYRRALACHGGLAQAHFNLGGVLRALGRIEEAMGQYRHALELAPANALTHLRLGDALQQQKRAVEAVDCYRAALRIDSGLAEAHLGLGCALQALEQPEAAAESYGTAIGIDPGLAEAHYNLGTLLQAGGRIEEAMACFQRALEINERFAEAHNNMGYACELGGLFARAETHFRRAIEVDPEHAVARCNLGRILVLQERISEGEAEIRRAIALQPGLAAAYINLANALQIRGRLAEAEAAARQAIAVDPDSLLAHSSRLFCLNYDPSRTEEEIFREYEACGRRFGSRFEGEWGDYRNLPECGRRLRVGYVSADFRRHSARHFTEPLLAHHDRSRVEVFCYSGAKREDDCSGRFRQLADHWRATAGLPDAALAARVREDAIDVLVDLSGHTEGNRLLMFARKPAPVQITWLGYGCTTGFRAMDYFVADDEFVPAGCQRYFTEQVWRLPRTMYCYRPPGEMPSVGPLPAQRNGYVTFGSFSRAIRYNTRVTALWARVLQAVPGSRLVLNAAAFKEEEARREFAGRFQDEGVDAARVSLICTAPQPRTWEAYNGIDISLDPFPHNGGVTTFESFWMGVPVISLADRPPLGRFGATLLGSMGMREWLAADAEQYLAIARRWGGDIQGLARVREGLRQRMRASALCDEAGFARAMEDAYRGMWARWCAAQRGAMPSC